MSRRKVLCGLSAGALLALAAAPVRAAEGGMPQLNFHDFPPQVVWLAIVFVVLYIAMAKVALPRVGEVLKTRADKISGDLDRATALKAESDRAIATYEKALADARAQAGAVSRDTVATLTKQSAERQAKLGGDLANRIKTAEANIAAAKAKAMTEIQGVAAGIAVDATRRLAGLEVSPADAAQAVSGAMRERG